MIVDGKRALAHIERVTNIRPIEGADNIEQCNVLGWNLICKKGEFKENDPCVYIEIDSKVPEREEFEFLRAKGFKVKTMKLSKFGVISQGLALPKNIFKELSDLSEGTDVTDTLGIKYSVEEDNSRKGNIDPNKKYQSMKSRHTKFFKHKIIKKLMKYEWFRRFIFIFLGNKKDTPKSFPNKFEFIHKTDEERIENMPQMLSNKTPLIVTEKLDGTSTTFILERTKKNKNKYEFYICSRNVRMLNPDQKCYHDHNIYCDMAIKYEVEDVLTMFMNDHPNLDYVCIQGESVGSVQGNPLKLKEDDFYAFNFITSDIGRWDSCEAKKLLNDWGIKFVPIIATDFILPDTMEEMKKMATEKSVINPNVLREGLVYRCATDNTISFKNVSREYLLNHNQ